MATIAEGAYGRRAVPPVARPALVGWLSGAEGTTLEWIGGPGADGGDGVPDRAEPAAPPVRRPKATLTVIEEFVPECPARPVLEQPSGAAGDLDDQRPVTGSP